MDELYAPSSRLFDASFLQTDSARRSKHGMPWAEEEKLRLRRLALTGMSLRRMCEEMQRPTAGILPKLRDLHVIAHTTCGNFAYTVYADRNISAFLKQPTQPQEIETMNDTKPTIETKTFIAGVDASKLTDLQIFDKIAELENQVKRWQAIDTKPQKLKALIDATGKDIATMATYVDGREAHA